MRSPSGLLGFSIACSALCGCGLAIAQQTGDAITTIHVVTRLLQIPILVVDRGGGLHSTIATDRVRVQMDRTAPFAPRSVRREDNDPITLAVLIDNAEEGTALPGLADGMAAMAEQLNPVDRVAVYVLDGCKLQRIHSLFSAEGSWVRAATTAALQFHPRPPAHRNTESCPKPVGLWDAAAWVGSSLAEEPGRRVLLLLSDGADDGSVSSAEQLRMRLTNNGVAAFAVAREGKLAPGAIVAETRAVAIQSPAPLRIVTNGSGGEVLETNRSRLSTAMTQFVQLVRGRYILEFQMPAGLGPGRHNLNVSVGDKRAVVHVAGTSIPVSAMPDTPLTAGPARNETP